MSFSIPTLRAFCNKIGGIATLNAPVISTNGDCGGCGYAVSGTITADVGNRVAYKIVSYSDSSTTVSCSSYDNITTGNIAYFDNTGLGGDHFPCVSRMPNGARILAVACNGSAFSNTANEYLTAIACPTSIPEPTISITSNTGEVVNFTVTSNYCDTTYIEFGPDFGNNPQACSQYGGPPDPTTSSSISITGSGTVYVGSLSCNSGSTYGIKAKTYWDGNLSTCTALESSIASAAGTIN